MIKKGITMKFRTILAALVACCVSISSMHGVAQTQYFLEGKIDVDELLNGILTGIYNQKEWYSEYLAKIKKMPMPDEAGKRKIEDNRSNCSGEGYDFWQDLKSAILRFKNTQLSQQNRTMDAKVASIEKNIKAHISKLYSCLEYYKGKGWIKK